VRSAALARPALPAHRAPVQDDEVARRNGCHVRAHSLDPAGGLVAKQERILVVDAALTVGQVGVAHPAGDDVDQSLPRPRVRDDNVHQFDGFAFLA
jgi:hypothetical protein